MRKQRSVMLAAVLVAACGLASPAMAQSTGGTGGTGPGGGTGTGPGGGSGTCTSMRSQIDYKIVWSYEMTIGSSCQITSAEGLAVADAFVSTLALGSGDTCCPCENEFGIARQTNADYANLLDPDEAVAGANATGCGNPWGYPDAGTASASTRIALHEGHFETNTKSTSWSQTSPTDRDCDGVCEGQSFCSHAGLAGAVSTGWYRVEFAEACDWLFLPSARVEVDVELVVDRWSCECVESYLCAVYEPCSPLGGVGEEGSADPANAPPPAMFTVMTVRLTDAQGTPTTHAFQGYLGTDENGDLVQKGIFQGLTTPPTGNQDVLLDASVDFPIDTTGAVSIEVNVQTLDMNTALMGDLDGDGQITFDDRILFTNALGTSFGDAGFDPRADFDGDGVIDAADLAAMNALPCIADINGDGVIDNDDLIQYLDWFNNADPRAEMDGVPGITLDDLNAYLAAFANACN